jgi:hypothetical protein
MSWATIKDFLKRKFLAHQGARQEVFYYARLVKVQQMG